MFVFVFMFASIVGFVTGCVMTYTYMDKRISNLQAAHQMLLMKRHQDSYWLGWNGAVSKMTEEQRELQRRRTDL